MAIFASNRTTELEQKMDKLLLELHRSNHIRIRCIQDLDAIECALSLDHQSEQKKYDAREKSLGNRSLATIYSMQNRFYAASRRAKVMLRFSAAS